MRRQALFFSAICALSVCAMATTVTVSVIDKDGHPVPDAVVVVESGNAGTPGQALPMQATIAQEKMQFIPMVTVVPAGAKVTFVNDDPWAHHVQGSAAGAAQFNTTTGGFQFMLAGRAPGKPPTSAEVTIEKPASTSALLFSCLIHGSMRGYVYVTDSPWTVKTGADGVATLNDVPEGPAQIKVWHADQLVDVPAQHVTLGSAPLTTKVQLSVVPRRSRI
ncbi:MAG: cupredoxin domain-containing protein [Rhodoferax sp.]